MDWSGAFPLHCEFFIGFAIIFNLRLQLANLVTLSFVLSFQTADLDLKFEDMAFKVAALLPIRYDLLIVLFYYRFNECHVHVVRFLHDPERLGLRASCVVGVGNGV